MNPTQIQTTLAPILTVISGILATKFAIFDGATWATILSALVAFAGVLWGAWAGRNAAVVSTTAGLPEVTSVTLDKQAAGSAALVASTPSNVQAK